MCVEYVVAPLLSTYPVETRVQVAIFVTGSRASVPPKLAYDDPSVIVSQSAVPVQAGRSVVTRALLVGFERIAYAALIPASAIAPAA